MSIEVTKEELENLSDKDLLNVGIDTVRELLGDETADRIINLRKDITDSNKLLIDKSKKLGKPRRIEKLEKELEIAEFKVEEIKQRLREELNDTELLLNLPTTVYTRLQKFCMPSSGIDSLKKVTKLFT